MRTNTALYYAFPKRKSKPVAAEAILKRALKKYGLDRDIARYHFVLKWEEIVGAEIARRSRPECIRGKSLFVRVADSMWAQELSFQKAVILHRLKKYVADGQQVEDIRFCVGELYADRSVEPK